MSRKYSTPEFVEQSLAIHGDVYDYSKTVYINAREKVTITCKQHGDFRQEPYVHKRSSGCPKCGDIRTSAAKRKTLPEFTEAAQKIHGGKYSYSLVDLGTHHQKVTILCQLHGEFEQSPANHLSGKGCPFCGKYGYKKNLPGTLYILGVDDLVKVGITNRDVQIRLDDIKKSSNLDFEILCYREYQDGGVPYGLEKEALKYLRKEYSATPLVFDGSSECFCDVNIVKLMGVVGFIHSL